MGWAMMRQVGLGQGGGEVGAAVGLRRSWSGVGWDAVG